VLPILNGGLDGRDGTIQWNVFLCCPIESAFRQYLSDYADDTDQQEWITGNLDVAPSVEELE